MELFGMAGAAAAWITLLAAPIAVALALVEPAGRSRRTPPMRDHLERRDGRPGERRVRRAARHTGLRADGAAITRACSEADGSACPAT